MTEHYNTQGTLQERSETNTAAAQSAPMRAWSAPTKRRRPKTEKELYAEATERAKTLREKLLARRAKNRDRLIEDLYSKFGIAAIDGDFDDADRLSELRSVLNQRLGLRPQEPR